MGYTFFDWAKSVGNHLYHFFTDSWSQRKKALANWILGDQTTSSGEDTTVETMPEISGAKNGDGSNKPIPLVLGRHKLTPYTCAKPFRTISGEDGETQTYHSLYILGYKGIEVSDIKLGQIDLASGTELEGDNTIDTFGNLESTDVANIYKDDSDNGVLVYHKDYDPMYTGNEYWDDDSEQYETDTCTIEKDSNFSYANGNVTQEVAKLYSDGYDAYLKTVHVAYTLYIPVTKKCGKLVLTYKKPIDDTEVIVNGTIVNQRKEGRNDDIWYYYYSNCPTTKNLDISNITSSSVENLTNNIGRYTVEVEYTNYVTMTVNGSFGKYIPLTFLKSVELESIEVKATERLTGELVVNGRWDATAYNMHLELQQGANSGREDGEMLFYPQKVVEEELNIELTHIDDENDTTGTGIMLAERISARNPQKVQIEFSIDGLFEVNSSGKKETGTVKVCIQYSIDGGKTFSNFGAPRMVATSSSDLWGTTANQTIIVHGQTITADVYSLTKNKAKTLRYIAEREFTYEEAVNAKNRYIEFRIFRYNVKKDDEDNRSYNDTLVLSAIRTWCYDYEKTIANGSTLIPQAPVRTEKRNLTARLAFQVDADPIDFKNQINELNCILTSYGRTCTRTEVKDADGNIIDYTYEWSNDTKPTQNPASIALMVLQHESRGQYAYDDSMFDLKSWGELYYYCAEQTNYRGTTAPRFCCNGIITTQGKTKQIVDDILSTCRARLILVGKKYGIWIDKEQETTKMLLNAQNVLSSSVKKDFAELTDGVKVKFINEDGDYSQDEMTVLYDDDLLSDPTVTPVYRQLEMKYQTAPAQIYKNGKYYLAEQKLRCESVVVKMSIDGNILSLGDKVGVQLESMSTGIGEGGEIKSLTKNQRNEIIKITLGSKIRLDNYDLQADTFMISINQTGGTSGVKIGNYPCTPVLDDYGFLDEVTLIHPIQTTGDSFPLVGDNVSLGLCDENEEQLVYSECLVYGKKDNGDGTFNFTLTPYQMGIYTADSGEIPEFDSKVTIRSNGIGFSPAAATTMDIVDANDKMADTVAEMAEAVEDMQETVDNLADNPTVYTSISSCGVAVNDNNIATKTQKISITFYARQGEEDLELYFDLTKIRRNLPTGYSVEVDSASGNPHTLILTIAEGTLVTTENLSLPVMFTSFKYDFTYEDENGDSYYDGSEGEYGERTVSDFVTEFECGFNVIGVQGGRYLGAVTAVTSNTITIKVGDTTEQKAVSSLILGDYFVFQSDDEISTLSEDGHFYKSQMYQFLGVYAGRTYMWALDDMREHIGGSLTDALAVANESLASNNSNVVQFLDHLTTNSIFVDRLIANTAFINELFTKQITINNGGIIKSDNFNGSFTDEGEIRTYGTEGWAVDASGHAAFNFVKSAKMYCKSLYIATEQGLDRNVLFFFNYLTDDCQKDWTTYSFALVKNGLIYGVLIGTDYTFTSEVTGEGTYYLSPYEQFASDFTTHTNVKSVKLHMAYLGSEPYTNKNDSDMLSKNHYLLRDLLCEYEYDSATNTWKLPHSITKVCATYVQGCHFIEVLFNNGISVNTVGLSKKLFYLKEISYKAGKRTGIYVKSDYSDFSTMIIQNHNYTKLTAKYYVATQYYNEEYEIKELTEN